MSMQHKLGAKREGRPREKNAHTSNLRPKHLVHLPPPSLSIRGIKGGRLSRQHHVEAQGSDFLPPFLLLRSHPALNAAIHIHHDRLLPSSLSRCWYPEGQVAVCQNTINAKTPLRSTRVPREMIYRGESVSQRTVSKQVSTIGAPKGGFCPKGSTQKWVNAKQIH